MSEQPTHGGSRPATRPDDGRHHNGGHTGTGPKPKSFTLKLGDQFYSGSRTADGTPCLGELWTVESVTRTKLIFRSDSGDEIFLIR